MKQNNAIITCIILCAWLCIGDMHALVQELTELTIKLQQLSDNITPKSEQPKKSDSVIIKPEKNSYKDILEQQTKSFKQVSFASQETMISEFRINYFLTMFNNVIDTISNNIPHPQSKLDTEQQEYCSASLTQLEKIKNNQVFVSKLSQEQKTALKELIIKLTNYLGIQQTYARWLTLEPNQKNQSMSSSNNEFIQKRDIPFRLGKDSEIIQIIALNQFSDNNIIQKPYEDDPINIGMNNIVYKQILETCVNNKNIFKACEKKEYVDFGGGSASCGYHAIKNALLILQALYAKTPEEKNLLFSQMVDILYATKKFGQTWQYETILGEEKKGSWRQIAINNKYGDNMGDWLGDNQLDPLFNLIAKEENLLENIQATITTKTIALQKAYKQIGYNPLANIKKQDDGVYVFFIYPTQTGEIGEGERGHWYTMVVNTFNGKCQYIIADSFNTPRYPNTFMNEQGVRKKFPIYEINEIIKIFETNK